MPEKEKPQDKAETKPAAPAATTPPDPTAQAAATKKNHKVIITLAIIAAVVFVIIPIIGLTIGGVILGNKLKENGVKIDANNQSVSVTDKNGNALTAGGNQTIPDDFPKGVPLYSGEVTATGKLTNDGKTGWTVAKKTSDSVSQVSASLTKSYSSDGWTTSTSNESGGGGILIAQKGDLHVSIFYDSKDGKTAILYTVINGSVE